MVAITLIDDWAFVLLRYVSIPRVVVWRVRVSCAAAIGEEARFEVVLPDRQERDRQERDPNGGSAQR